MKKSRTFPDIMLQISLAAIACMLFNIPDQTRAGIPVTMYVLVFGYSVLSYLCSRLFLRNPKSYTAVAVFDLFFILAGMAAAFAFRQFESAIYVIYFGAVFLVLSLMAFKETARGININILIICFDILSALMMLYILFVELGSGKAAAAIPGAAGIIAAFAGIMVMRSGSSISGRDWFYKILILAVILVIALLVRMLAGDSLRNGFTEIFAGIGAAFKWIGHILKEFLLFFARLFPQEKYDALDQDMEGGISLPEGQGGEETEYSVLPLLILIGTAAIAAVIIAVIVFRKHRISGSKTVSAARINENRSNRVSLWKALKIWAREKLYRIRVRLYFFRNRNTPAGKYYRLVRSGKHSANAIRQGETPGEFLRRYINSLQPGDRRIPEYTALIDELNKQLYRRSHTI